MTQEDPKDVLILKIPESCGHCLMKLFIVSFDLVFSILLWILELHTGQLVHDLAHSLPDDVPGDLIVGLGGGLH